MSNNFDLSLAKTMIESLISGTTYPRDVIIELVSRKTSTHKCVVEWMLI